MTKQNSTGNAQNRPETLAKNYGIKSTTYYERTKFLGIKAQKDENNKAYLTPEQVEMMDALHEYINENGKMEGFTFSRGEDEGVVDSTDVDVETAEAGGKMAVVGKNELSAPETGSIIEEEIPQAQPDFSQGMEELMRKAAEIKAQGLAMPDLVALQLAAQMNFEDLPEDLQRKVSQVREAASPKQQPALVAANLLQQWRSSRQSGN